MSIAVSLSEKRDKELIDWLSTKRNKSYFIRDVLYSYMLQERRGTAKLDIPCQGFYLDKENISDNKDTKNIKNNEENNKTIQESKTVNMIDEKHNNMANNNNNNNNNNNIDTSDIPTDFLSNIFNGFNVISK